MARVRIIATYETGTSFYRDLPPFLVEHGHETTILMTAAQYRAGRTPLAEALRGTGVQLDLVPGPADASGTTAKLIAMLRFVFGAVRRTLFGPQFDANVFFSTPPLFAAWGIVLRLLRRQHFVCLVMDVWPDVLAPGDQSLGIVQRVLRWVSRETWRRADGVIVIGRCMRDLVLAAGVDRDRVHLVSNWAPAGTLEHAGSARPLRAELGVAQDDLLVMYAGNMGLAHTFDEVIEVAARTEADDVPVHWVFVGGGTRRAGVEQAVAERGLQKVSFMGFQPEDVFAATLASADVHLVTMRPGYEGLVVPSKTFSPWAVGRPVLYVGSPDGEIARAIMEESVGRVVANDDVDALEEVIRDMCRDRDAVAAMGTRAAELSHGDGRFSPSTTMSAYLPILAAVLDRQPASAGDALRSR